MTLRDYIQAPFPKPKRSRKVLLWIVLIGFSCGLFIILYKPFGIENQDGEWYFNLVILSFSVVFIIAVLFMEWLIPYWLPSLFSNWTLGKALIWYTWVILFVGAVIFLYKSYWAGFSDFTVQEYFLVILRTLALAATVSFVSLGIYQYLNRKRLSLITMNEDYMISTQDGKSVKLNVNDILFISSDDNYVDVHFENESERDRMVLRSSLKNIENQVVNPLSPIHRCHRGYLININRFEIGKSTSRTMTVLLKNFGDEIPVSKQHLDSIRQLLQIRP